MRLHCPSCGQAIVAEDVNIARVVAKCRACNSVFRFEDQIAVAVPEPRTAPAASVKVPLPDGIAVEHDEALVVGDYRSTARPAGNLRIRRRWFHPRHLLMVPFCIAWDAFLLFWYATAVVANAPWIMFVFPIAHLAVGVGLTYSTLAGLMNHTVVSIAGDRLKVEHGPLPWPGNRDLASSAVRQIYSEECRPRGRNAAVRYSINAIVDGGPTLALVKNLESARQALYVEQELEQRLGIADARVPGALSRGEALQSVG
jgi:hypothetical protein